VLSHGTLSQCDHNISLFAIVNFHCFCALSLKGAKGSYLLGAGGILLLAAALANSTVAITTSPASAVIAFILNLKIGSVMINIIIANCSKGILQYLGKRITLDNQEKEATVKIP